MKIKLNDNEYEVKENTSLSSFIRTLEVTTEGIAVAINYQVIPKTKWDETILTDNMELIIVHAVSGG